MSCYNKLSSPAAAIALSLILSGAAAVPFANAQDSADEAAATLVVESAADGSVPDDPSSEPLSSADLPPAPDQTDTMDAAPEESPERSTDTPSDVPSDVQPDASSEPLADQPAVNGADVADDDQISDAQKTPGQTGCPAESLSADDTAQEGSSLEGQLDSTADPEGLQDASAVQAGQPRTAAEPQDDPSGEPLAGLSDKLASQPSGELRGSAAPDAAQGEPPSESAVFDGGDGSGGSDPMTGAAPSDDESSLLPAMATASSVEFPAPSSIASPDDGDYVATTDEGPVASQAPASSPDTNEPGCLPAATAEAEGQTEAKVGSEGQKTLDLPFAELGSKNSTVDTDVPNGSEDASPQEEPAQPQDVAKVDVASDGSTAQIVFFDKRFTDAVNVAFNVVGDTIGSQWYQPVKDADGVWTFCPDTFALGAGSFSAYPVVANPDGSLTTLDPIPFSIAATGGKATFDIDQETGWLRVQALDVTCPGGVNGLSAVINLPDGQAYWASLEKQADSSWCVLVDPARYGWTSWQGSAELWLIDRNWAGAFVTGESFTANYGSESFEAQISGDLSEVSFRLDGGRSPFAEAVTFMVPTIAGNLWYAAVQDVDGSWSATTSAEALSQGTLACLPHMTFADSYVVVCPQSEFVVPDAYCDLLCSFGTDVCALRIDVASLACVSPVGNVAACVTSPGGQTLWYGLGSLGGAAWEVVVPLADFSFASGSYNVSVWCADTSGRAFEVSGAACEVGSEQLQTMAHLFSYDTRDLHFEFSGAVGNVADAVSFMIVPEGGGAESVIWAPGVPEGGGVWSFDLHETMGPGWFNVYPHATVGDKTFLLESSSFAVADPAVGIDFAVSDDCGTLTVTASNPRCPTGVQSVALCLTGPDGTTSWYSMATEDGTLWSVSVDAARLGWTNGVYTVTVYANDSRWNAVPLCSKSRTLSFQRLDVSRSDAGAVATVSAMGGAYGYADNVAFCVSAPAGTFWLQPTHNALGGWDTDIAYNQYGVGLYTVTAYASVEGIPVPVGTCSYDSSFGAPIGVVARFTDAKGAAHTVEGQYIDSTTYVFLPSGTDLAHVTFRFGSNADEPAEAVLVSNSLDGTYVGMDPESAIDFAGGGYQKDASGAYILYVTSAIGAPVCEVRVLSTPNASSMYASPNGYMDAIDPDEEGLTICIGDSWCNYKDNPYDTWAKWIAQLSGWNVETYYQVMAGYARVGIDSSFVDLVSQAIEDHASDTVSRVILYGGINDGWYTEEDLARAVDWITSSIKACWPDADIHIFVGDLANSLMFAERGNLIEAVATCETHGAIVHPTCWTWLYDADYDLVRSDRIHPTSIGSRVVAQNMLLELQGVDTTVWWHTVDLVSPSAVDNVDAWRIGDTVRVSWNTITAPTGTVIAAYNDVRYSTESYATDEMATVLDGYNGRVVVAQKDLYNSNGNSTSKLNNLAL